RRAILSNDFDATYANSANTAIRETSYQKVVSGELRDNVFEMDAVFKEADSNHERLAKGIAGYNQGADPGLLGVQSWPAMLKTVPNNVDCKTISNSVQR